MASANRQASVFSTTQVVNNVFETMRGDFPRLTPLMERIVKSWEKKKIEVPIVIESIFQGREMTGIMSMTMETRSYCSPSAIYEATLDAARSQGVDPQHGTCDNFISDSLVLFGDLKIGSLHQLERMAKNYAAYHFAVNTKFHDPNVLFIARKPTVAAITPVVAKSPGVLPVAYNSSISTATLTQGIRDGSYQIQQPVLLSAFLLMMLTEEEVMSHKIPQGKLIAFNCYRACISESSFAGKTVLLNDLAAWQAKAKMSREALKSHVPEAVREFLDYVRSTATPEVLAQQQRLTLSLRQNENSNRVRYNRSAKISRKFA